MSIFASKLATLPETITLSAGHDKEAISRALRVGKGRVAVAIGSGGSVVAAHFLARCRQTLQLGRTIVLTPMEFILSSDEWADCDVWLFSAGANNADIAAAFHRAEHCDAAAIHLVTTRPDGATARAAMESRRAELHALPVADPKDSFLATHSLIATTTAILLACDVLCEDPIGPSAHAALTAAAPLALARSALADTFRAGDTLILLQDPRLDALGSLFETSLWETGIAPVQRTDFRNFAHGRHVWSAKYPDTMLALALTAAESRSIWAPIADALPDGVRRVALDCGGAGRYDLAVSLLAGLAAIRDMGEVAGIDPGKPGRGRFAEAIYDNDALHLLSKKLTPPVRQKLSARELHAPQEQGSICVCASYDARQKAFGQAEFYGLVLDYDGTIVTTKDRGSPPRSDIVSELERLARDGLMLGIATGRGRSAGQMLRAALPETLHHLILVGYYNGAHIRPLTVDIEHDRPAQHEDVAAIAGWIAQAGLLKASATVKRGRVQAEVKHADLVDQWTFKTAIAACPLMQDGRMRLVSSQHSFDFVPKGVSKLAVVETVRKAGRGGAVLTIGDSGSPLGNDFDLLSSIYGISVGNVCGSAAGSWSMFGSKLVGPDALLKILQALIVADGVAKLTPAK